MKRRCASGRETPCTRTTYRITKAYIKNIKITINMNIMTSNTIRITTRNHDRALKVLRHCVTIKKKIAVTRMATMGTTTKSDDSEA